MKRVVRAFGKPFSGSLRAAMGTTPEKEPRPGSMSLYDLMRTVHMALRHEAPALSPRFEMGPAGRRVWVEWEGQAYEITVACVDAVPETRAQRNM